MEEYSDVLVSHKYESLFTSLPTGTQGCTRLKSIAPRNVERLPQDSASSLSWSDIVQNKQVFHLRDVLDCNRLSHDSGKDKLYTTLSSACLEETSDPMDQYGDSSSIISLLETALSASLCCSAPMPSCSSTASTVVSDFDPFCKASDFGIHSPVYEHSPVGVADPSSGVRLLPPVDSSGCMDGCEKLPENSFPWGSSECPSLGSPRGQISGTPSDDSNDINQQEMSVLHEALLSLYTDEILPVVFNLKGRLKEINCSDRVRTRFLDMYESFPDKYVVTFLPEQKQKCVFLHELPADFNNWIDANDSSDLYPQEMWNQFTDYLRTLMHNADHTKFEFARGRYGMAKKLQELQLPFFPNFTLGKYCHVVQLAITKRKLLAYENNVLKPVATCVSFTNAMLGIPDQKQVGKDYITDIGELQHYISQLLQQYPNGFNLSTLKRKIKLRFNRELCQTVFHRTKLIDLVALPEIAKICSIDTDSRHMKIVPCGRYRNRTPMLGSGATLHRDTERLPAPPQNASRMSHRSAIVSPEFSTNRDLLHRGKPQTENMRLPATVGSIATPRGNVSSAPIFGVCLEERVGNGPRLYERFSI